MSDYRFILVYLHKISVGKLPQIYYVVIDLQSINTNKTYGISVVSCLAYLSICGP